MEKFEEKSILPYECKKLIDVLRSFFTFEDPDICTVIVPGGRVRVLIPSPPEKCFKYVRVVSLPLPPLPPPTLTRLIIVVKTSTDLSLFPLTHFKPSKRRVFVFLQR